MVNKARSSMELTFLVFIMSCFIVGVGVYGFIQIGILNRNSQELFEDRLIPMNQLGDVRYYNSVILSTAHRASKKQITFDVALAKVKQAQDSVNTNWKAYVQTYLTPEEKIIVDKTTGLLKESSNSVEKLKLILAQGDGSGLDAIIKNELSQSLTPVMDEVSKLRRLQVKVGKKIYEDNLKGYTSYTQKFLLILLIAMAFTVPFAYYLIKKNLTIINSVNLSRAKLFLTEKNYRNLIEYAGEAILVLNEETEIIDLNDYACQLFGYTRNEMLMMKISSLIAPDEVNEQAFAIENVRKNKSALVYRKIKRKDGTILEAEISARLMEGRGFFGIIRDITERNKAETALKESEEKYRYLFNNNPACIFIWDLETLKIQEVNETVLNKYGYSREEWSTMTVLDYRPEEDHEKLKEFARKMLLGEEIFIKQNWKHFKKDGEEIIMEISPHTIIYNNRPAALTLANDVTEKVRAEAKLAEREAQLNLFIEHSPACLAMFDNDMQYIATSRRWISDYNLTGQDIIGKSHYEVFPEIGQEWKDIHQRCLKGAVEKREEDSFVRADGSIEWLRWEVRPWYKATSEIGGIIMFTEVITERKRATELFKNQFENSPDIILYVNKYYKIEAINRTRTPEISVDKVIGADCISVLPEESREPAREALEKCFSNGEHLEIENKISSGEWVRSRFVPIVTNNEVTHVMIFGTDITERKLAELKLTQSEEKYRALTENISDAIVLVNSDFEIQYQSPSAAKISGYGLEDFKSKQLLSFIFHKDLIKAEKFFREVISSPGIPLQNQFRLTHKDGHLIWVEGTALNLLDQASINALILNYRDITERKKAEQDLILSNEELKKTNSELDRFVYSTSHDLRAPLKSMLGLINISKTEIEEKGTADENSTLIERLTMLNTSVSKLDNFIEDILNYSRNARMELEHNEIDFETLVKDIKGNLKFAEGAKVVDLKIQMDSDLKFVCDYNRLAIIMNNILSNAYKYFDRSKENPFIIVNFKCDNRKAIITIEDNGVGIDENEQGKIFDMFYRSSSLSTGSGIGLYIVKETLDKLKGTITVQSKVNVGTLFTIKIPNRIKFLK
ncbi:signal transduction histidine kinase [Flavobacterium enshiense DK69]|uniref:PAS domain S-box protein n=1 Tax=Flavobacterium enshiense TaxID=1341165 RepID=UPI0003C63A0F|nr:PAS domain S-box protein [Flavobacterium enshiense]ESU20317.1 signal transduction histidine kinase [Flavobacterium enshiense DK69]